jgi:hypothetical protein
MGVPDTNTFSLQDVTNSVGSSGNLSAAYAAANNAYFDINYLYYKDVMPSLYGFRNYDNVSKLSITSVTVDNSGTMIIHATHNFEPVQFSKDNGVNWYTGTYSGTDATYTFTGLTAGTYYIKAKDYKQTVSWANNPVIIDQYTDWWLPSRDEMQKMHDNLYAYSVGNLDAVSYWTSSQWDADYAWYYDMPTAGYYHDALKWSSVRFRPSRSFTTSSSSSYALRDIGPAKGWIYYIENTAPGVYKYYEAYTDDAFAYGSYGNSEEWADSDDSVTTSTAIGTGASNTTAMISTVISHAGLACDGLSTLIIR